MKLVRFATTLALLGAASASGQTPTDDNAALQYWQGIGLMTDATKKMLEGGPDVAIEGEMLQDVRDGNPRLEFLHAGAAMPRCDWGLDFRKGPELLMPHLGESRDLARLAVLRARYRFENGRYVNGVDDVLATFELSKDVGETPVLISLLVRYAIENMAIDTLARHLPKMDRVSLDHLAKALESLPAEDSLKRVWPAESKFFLDWFLERLTRIEKESGGDAGKWAEDVLELAVFDKEDAERIRAVGVPEPKKLRALVESAKGLLSELEKATDMTNVAEQDARLAELQKPFEGDPVARIFVPAQNKIFHTRRRWQANHAMLDAAVAVAREGEGVLKDKRYADPFGDGPFEYRKIDGGFELRSKLTFEGKPVLLTVGKAK